LLTSLKDLLQVLSHADRRRMWGVFLLNVLVAIVEALGIASIMPFMAVASNPSAIETTSYLRLLFELGGFQSSASFLTVLGFATLVVLVGSVALRALSLWAITHFTHQQVRAISTRLAAGYLRQPYSWFLKRNSADLGATVLSEVSNYVHGCLNPALIGMAHALIAIALVGVLIAVNPVLAVAVTVIIGGSYAVIYHLAKRRLAIIGEQRRVANLERHRVLLETFGGIKDVKIAGLEDRFLSEFERPSAAMASQAQSGAILTELPSLAMQGLVYGGTVLAVLWLIVSGGEINSALPVAAVYGFAAYRLMPSLQGLYRGMGMIRLNMSVASTLRAELESIEALPKPETLATRAHQLGLKTRLELRGVTFAYEGSPRPALRNVSVSIPARSSLGIVGSTGSGKTTLVDVLLGLLTPQSGQVVVDGNALDPTLIRSWQNSIGYVPQSIFLADATIAENIAFGVPKAAIDQQRLEYAAMAANLHHFVMSDLPEGYETNVGEKGVRLSGGQRQRIGIARALYRDPDILIFDEATSALDTVTERAVMEAISALGGQKTLVLIAHRLSTIRSCDNILLLSQGEVSAQGSYEELVKNNLQFGAMAQ
jgi:ATP-binding cassette, subfamily B, bacterial PglK